MNGVVNILRFISPHLLNHTLIGVLILLTGCTTKVQERKKGDSKVQEIVIVNVGRIDRCEIGALINAISKCNPKVIGINLLFTEERNRRCDSILQKSIHDSGKIVLVEGFQGGHPVKSIMKFSKTAYNGGHNGFLTDDAGVVTSYERLIDHEGKWALTFPFLIALQYNKDRAAELSSKITAEEYPLVLYHDKDSLTIVDQASVLTNCDALHEKLVIVGYLGPDDEDLVTTKISGRSVEKTYATVVQANNVLDILYDLE